MLRRTELILRLNVMLVVAVRFDVWLSRDFEIQVPILLSSKNRYPEASKPGLSTKNQVSVVAEGGSDGIAEGRPVADVGDVHGPADTL
jgi:hypothetical protein